MPNQTHDVNGRPYAKLSELRAGDYIELDEGFDCHGKGLAQLSKDDGRLFFPCSEGHHYLDGQADDGEHCVGVYKP